MLPLLMIVAGSIARPPAREARSWLVMGCCLGR
jgi:hypothetical protein